MDRQEIVKRIAETIARETELLVAQYLRQSGSDPVDIVICDQVKSDGTHRIWIEKKQDRKIQRIKVIEWQNEDEMTGESMYDALWPLSKVDLVRLFPKKIEVTDGGSE